MSDHISLYESNAGDLFLIASETLGVNVTDARPNRFADDAEELRLLCVQDWTYEQLTPEQIAEIANHRDKVNGPKLVAEYNFGKATSSGCMGRAAQRYVGDALDGE